MFIVNRIRWLCCCLLCIPVVLMAATTEVRVLIDVSGSMKQSDPLNLRVPALKLLTHLIPSGSKAGVWMFDQSVSNLVPLATVNAAWQNKAQTAASRIHSKGLYTNIGAALDKALQGWAEQPADKQQRRSLILLTDGRVDLNGDAAANAKERERISKELLPKLLAAGVKLHTVALSDQADEALLSELSASTDAWFIKVKDASELDKSFLKLFEQAVERDTVPLKDNKFNVDASINEFTLLAFRKPGTPAASLVMPNGKVYTADKLPDTIKWYSEASYDLITVTKPEGGEWSIQADIDPQNRVMVVSDLAMKVSELPNNLFVGESPELQASLTEKDQVITRKEFLMNVKMTLEQQVAANSKRLPIMDDGSDGDATLGDGVFTIKMEPSTTEGEWTFITEAKSPTFQRQKRQSVKFQPMPLATELKPAEDGQDNHLVIKPKTEWLKAEGLVIAAKVVLPDGSQQQVVATHEADAFVLPLARKEQGSKYQVTLAIKGQTPAGRELQLLLPTLHLDSHAPVTQVEASAAVATAEPAHSPEPAKHEDEPKVAEQPAASAHSGLWIAVAIGVNLLLVAFAWWLFRWLKQRRQAKVQALSAVLES